jgi:Kef-type K+ transport system membrane component KefB
MRKILVGYSLMVLAFGAGIYFALERGQRLEVAAAAGAPASVTAPARSAGPRPAPEGLSGREPGILSRLAQPLPRLLLQLLTIVVCARLLGALFVRFGQPAVIGEIVAGIVLGPSLLGSLAPGVASFLFAPSSVGVLKVLAEIGVLLFLFQIGLGLDLGALRNRAQSAVVVSHASIVVPFFLGVALSLFLYRDLAPSGVRFAPFALFLGVAMSITAFPVLARILEDRGLTRTPLGVTAITCAAVDDATAWTLLAIVIASVGAAGAASAVATIVLALVFVLVMLRFVGPLVRRGLEGAAGRNEPGKTAVAVILVFLFASALATELIGIHALFGAFLAGVVMPRAPRLRVYLGERLEYFSSVFLLPLFFAFTGLRTQVGLLDDAKSWIACAAIVVVATVGKLGATTAAARLTGMGWPDAFSLGALMNTRGLVELIALNLGYELGILSPRIFAMMVLMALVTTFATGPLLSLASRLARRGPGRIATRASF